MHAGFRAELTNGAPLPMRTLPLILLRDLLRAEAMACTAVNAYRLRRIGELFYSLLSRGGLTELALCAQCLPAAWLSDERMTELPFGADMAESLRHACEKRTRNPMYVEQAGRYAALEKYFAAFAARGRA